MLPTAFSLGKHVQSHESDINIDCWSRFQSVFVYYYLQDNYARTFISRRS